MKNSTENPILVIVGMAGSGKSTVASHLKQKGWHIIRFGGITMRELEKRNLPVNESNEKAVREELREKHGMDAYARLSLPLIEETLATSPVLIDGLYSWAEYKFLKQHFRDRIKVVAVYTTRSLRYKRISQRTERPLTFEEAEQRDFAEIENVEKGGPIAIADYTLINDGSEVELVQAVDRLFTEHIPR